MFKFPIKKQGFTDAGNRREEACGADGSGVNCFCTAGARSVNFFSRPPYQEKRELLRPAELRGRYDVW